MSGKTDRRITFLSLTTAALPPDGSGVAWWLAWEGTEKLKPTIKLKVDDGEIAVLPFIICLF